MPHLEPSPINADLSSYIWKEWFNRIYKYISEDAIFKTLVDGDATPDIHSAHNYTTNNTSATTITDLDSGANGQTIIIVIGDANTTIDFTGTNLKGNGGVDWTPSQYDHMTCTYDGTYWYCDVSNN